MGQDFARLSIARKPTGNGREHLGGIPRIVLFLQIDGSRALERRHYVDFGIPRQPCEKTYRHGQLLKRLAVPLVDGARSE